MNGLLKYLYITSAISMFSPQAGATEPRHAILYYLNIESISEEVARPIVAYVSPSGEALDWMFDSIIIFHIDLAVDRNPTQTVVDQYSDELFSGGGLATLARTVANLRTELGDPAYRLHIYLAAPYSTDTNVNTNVLNLIDQYDALNPPELELVGFYWGYEEGLSGSSVSAAVSRITNGVSYIHGKGYEAIWIPMNHDTYIDGWLNNCANCDFDRITLQVGYAYKNVGIEQFLTADNRMHAHNLDGVELELGSVTNNTVPGDPVITSANYYLNAADQYNWSENSFTTYYYVSPISDHSYLPDRRPIYDRIYRHISVNPSRSVLTRVRVPVSQDTFAEQAADRKSVVNGAKVNLEVGTNGYPNANRTYLLFDDPDLMKAGALLSAHVVLKLDYWPYGSKINDVRLYRQYNPTWSESTLNGNNEPFSQMTSVAPHRFYTGYARFSIDITDDLTSMRSSGTPGVSYMLRRDVEDGTPAEASFRSKDYSDGSYASAIEYVYIPSSTVTCGNGIIETGETCDPPGNCPDCDDGNPCTTDSQTGTAASCNVICSNSAINSCSNGDGCCPSGCNSGNDSDCTAICGNGVIESGETCDPPSSCPADCSDSDPCTPDAKTGSSANCNVICSYISISACMSGDGCCPPGCNSGNDSDCTAICGNGVIESGETCDPPGNCPASCNDGNACTNDNLSGNAWSCNVVCSHSANAVCLSNDGCCPAGCDSAGDNDCSRSCGNGLLEDGETCDPPGSCPVGCDDGNMCSSDLLIGSAANCNAACINTVIDTCLSGDGCCPPQCGSADTDCLPRCGNGAIESGETCDPPSRCPTDCDDEDQCTLDALTGSANECTAACMHTPIAGCANRPGDCDGGNCPPEDVKGACGCGNAGGGWEGSGFVIPLLLGACWRKGSSRGARRRK